MAPARSESTKSKAKAAARDAPPPRATINGSRKILTFRGHQHLRQRIVLSVLSGKSVKIEGIRQDEVDIGLRGEYLRCEDAVQDPDASIDSRLRGIFPPPRREDHKRHNY